MNNVNVFACTQQFWWTTGTVKVRLLSCSTLRRPSNPPTRKDKFLHAYQKPILLSLLGKIRIRWNLVVSTIRFNQRGILWCYRVKAAGSWTKKQTFQITSVTFISRKKMYVRDKGRTFRWYICWARIRYHDYAEFSRQIHLLLEYMWFDFKKNSSSWFQIIYLNA